MVKLKLLNRRMPIVLAATGVTLAAMAVPALAATSFPFADQFKSIITTAGTWIASVTAGSGGVMVGYHALMRNFNDDPQHVAHHTHSMRKVAIGTGIGAGASGLGTWIYSTFSSGGTSTGMLFSHHTAVALITKVFGA